MLVQPPPIKLKRLEHLADVSYDTKREMSHPALRMQQGGF